MKLRHCFTAIIVACALVSVMAIPVRAIENEFHGYYQVMPVFSNFNGSITTEEGDGFYHPEGKPADADTANYIQQRVRLGYIGKANDNLKLVTKFEMDYTFWGNSSYSVGRNQGGALGSDSVQIETKHLYLDLNIPSSPINAKIGMQGFDDRFEGVFLSSDAAGALFSVPFGNLSAVLGFFRLFDDAKDNVLGKETADLYALDLGLQVNPNVKVGGAYYYVTDDRGDADITLNTLGVSAEAGVGPATLNGFILYQFGDLGSDIDVKAFVANAGAIVKAGPGTARAEFMYASGDDDDTDSDLKSLVTISGEYGYYSNHLVILGRDEYALTIDNAIVYDVGFNGQGSILASAGYDLPVGKATLGATIGGGWINENIFDRDGKFLGTEINADLTYPVFENLTAVARVAFVALGNYFDGVAAGGDDPDNPWDARVVLIYSF